jgi:two-component system, chemotaxis family, sensor kinase CheA
VQGINPLSEVEVAIKNRLGHDARRHLSFHFNRVQEDGAVRHLLVTVQDISARIDLEARLQGERQRSQKEFSMLLKAIDADPAMLRQFVARAESSLLEINDIMRSTSAAHGEHAILLRLEEIARLVHSVKGDAGALGLETIASQAHLFETELQRIRQVGGASGDLGAALLSLPMPLEDLLGKIGALKALAGMNRPSAAATSPETINTTLARLAQDVASDSGKKVHPLVRLGSQDDLDVSAGSLVREIAIQLVRNAVVHGIESPATRKAAGKPEEGKLEVQLLRVDHEWTLIVRDDGAGLSATRVRQKLLELRWYTAAQLDSFDDRQIVSHIFKPGFSTAGAVSMHAGRGVGLDLVQANVQKLGARMMLASTPAQFTEFRIKFAA